MSGEDLGYRRLEGNRLIDRLDFRAQGLGVLGGEEMIELNPGLIQGVAAVKHRLIELAELRQFYGGKQVAARNAEKIQNRNFPRYGGRQNSRIGKLDGPVHMGGTGCRNGWRIVMSGQRGQSVCWEVRTDRKQHCRGHGQYRRCHLSNPLQDNRTHLTALMRSKAAILMGVTGEVSAKLRRMMAATSVAGTGRPK